MSGENVLPLAGVVDEHIAFDALAAENDLRSGQVLRIFLYLFFPFGVNDVEFTFAFGVLLVLRVLEPLFDLLFQIDSLLRRTDLKKTMPRAPIDPHDLSIAHQSPQPSVRNILMKPHRLQREFVFVACIHTSQAKGG